MFRRYEGQYKRNPLPLLILRLTLSLAIFSIFAIGIYQAFKYFSGVDPATSDPKSLVASLVTAEGASNFVEYMLNISPEEVAANLQRLIENPSLFWENPQTILTKQQPQASQIRNFDPNAPKILTFALVADSHNDNTNLKKALELSKSKGAKFVIGLGDYTEVGAKEEIEAVREVFLSARLPYYLTSGDHDLWSARNQKQDAQQIFRDTFSPPYQAFTDSEIRFILISNSDNYLGIDQLQMDWVEEELNRVRSGSFKKTFIFMHEPTFHPSSDHVMGKETASLKEQSQYLNKLLSSSKVSEVFFGDTHYFSHFEEPQNHLSMTVVGAVTQDRNAQKSRFAIVDVYQDGSYNVSDIEI